MNAARTYRHVYSRVCKHCNITFNATAKSAAYCCHQCRTLAATQRRIRSSAGDWLRTPISCGQCGTVFFRTLETGPNKKYCCKECSVKAQGRDFQRFKEANVDAMKSYNRERVKKHGRDTLMKRLWKRYGNLPLACECCGEARVLDIAHKPEHRRNGAHRTLDQYQRHMFWILCPTCHRVLDEGIESPEQMGLR